MAVRDQIFFIGRVLEHDRRHHLFAVNSIGLSETHGLSNGRMRKQSFVDLAWRDLFTATIDQLFQPADQYQIAVVVEVTLIASAKPAVRERGEVGLRVSFITAKNVGSLD